MSNPTLMLAVVFDYYISKRVEGFLNLLVGHVKTVMVTGILPCDDSSHTRLTQQISNNNVRTG
jgi:hypothetical protein